MKRGCRAGRAFQFEQPHVADQEKALVSAEFVAPIHAHQRSYGVWPSRECHDVNSAFDFKESQVGKRDLSTLLVQFIQTCSNKKSGDIPAPPVTVHSNLQQGEERG